MAILSTCPDPKYILALRGKVDYSFYRGLFYARAWPRRPRHPRSTGVKASASTFASYSQRVRNTAPQLRTYAEELTRKTEWTWKDMLTSAAYGKVGI